MTFIDRFVPIFAHPSGTPPFTRTLLALIFAAGAMMLYDTWSALQSPLTPAFIRIGVPLWVLALWSCALVVIAKSLRIVIAVTAINVLATIFQLAILENGSAAFIGLALTFLGLARIWKATFAQTFALSMWTGPRLRLNGHVYCARTIGGGHAYVHIHKTDRFTLTYESPSQGHTKAIGTYACLADAEKALHTTPFSIPL